jgi:hypothetical protein
MAEDVRELLVGVLELALALIGVAFGNQLVIVGGRPRHFLGPALQLSGLRN